MKKLLSSLIISAAAVFALLIFEPGRPSFASPNSPLHAVQRKDPPLTRSLLEQWLALKPPARDEFIASYVARNGIAFRPTAEILKRLEMMSYYRTLRALEAWRPELTPTPDKLGKKKPTEPVSDPNTVTILVAKFRGIEQENYLVAETITRELRAATSSYRDINIQPLDETITEQMGNKDGSTYAREVGTKRKASIVLWGYYGVTSERVNINVYFEVLRAPKSLTLLRNFETKTLPIADLKGFNIQIPLSKEMTYLVLLTVGLARYESGDYDAAIERFTQALARADAPSYVPEQMIDSTKIYFYRGLAYAYKAEANAIDQAIADFDKVIQITPDFKAYVNRAALYYKKAQYDQAIDDLDKAIKLKPDFATAYYDLGLVYIEKAQYDQAIADLDKAIKLNPNDAEAYYNRGLAYYKKAQYDQAVADNGTAIKLKSNYFEAYNNRGSSYINMGQYDRAIADYTKVIQIKPDTAEAYYNRGYAHRKKAQYDQAIADFNKAINLKPDFAVAYFNRGLTYFQKARHDQAIADFDKAINLKFDLAESYNNRGNAYCQKGQYDQAIADFDTAIKLKPEIVNAYVNRGIAYDAKGQYDQAITEYGTAIKLNADLAEAYYNRALTYYKKGELDGAAADLKSVLRMTADINLRQRAEQLLQKLGVK